ncbi:BTB/POZ and MATH domain-containing protein 2-like isoform X2 [Carex littledalei]|uniref:BTB/POZ and MATH domain-containing protein 2-like isoform X2 n=1 Tax=Carex littledalei TaxID=544730 RepID=A0A833V7S4_9POAL|nr:BTB/POZ and MATH domain-containing protein 2-like isoform X2 [Carex littledalei]
MGSSAQAINCQNLETTSTLQTETITGSHLFKINGYSLTKGIGIGKTINSSPFIVGGYSWIIEVFPEGVTGEYKNFISIRVRVEGKDTEVKALITFTILQQNGTPSNLSVTSPVWTITNPAFRCWSSWEFAKRTEFEASEHLKDDSFTVKCIITVIIRTKLEVTHPYGVIISPSNLSQNLANYLLESGEGADVTFVVTGEIFKAHRCVLAARSDVFNAELFGCMKEKLTDTITVEDIEAPVFKSMLYFIYSDSLPNLR